MATKNDDANVKLGNKYIRVILLFYLVVFSVADFGFAVIADGYSISSQCGTPGYIAPEILENKSYGKSLLSFAVHY